MKRGITFEDVGEAIVEMRADLRVLKRDMKTLNANVSATIVEQQRHGQAIAKLDARCYERGKRASDEYDHLRRLEDRVDELSGSENTGRLEVEKIKTEVQTRRGAWRGIAVLIGAASAAVGLIYTLFLLMGSPK